MSFQPRWQEVFPHRREDVDQHDFLVQHRRAVRDAAWQMQQIAFDDVVYIIPYYEQAIQAYRVDRFSGWLISFPKVELSDTSSLVVVEAVK